MNLNSPDARKLSQSKTRSQLYDLTDAIEAAVNQAIRDHAPMIRRLRPSKALLAYYVLLGTHRFDLNAWKKLSPNENQHNPPPTP